MFHHLTGRIFEKKLGFLVLEVAGVGYQLNITLSTYEELPATGQEAFVFTYHMVRETEQALYGFSSREERSLFLNFIKVSSIGPASALQILNQAPMSQLVQAVVTGDVAFLCNLKGVGRKTAERIIVELRDRLSALSLPNKGNHEKTVYPEDAYLALLALGLQPDVARRKLEDLGRLAKPPQKTDEWIRLALKHAG